MKEGLVLMQYRAGQLAVTVWLFHGVARRMLSRKHSNLRPHYHLQPPRRLRGGHAAHLAPNYPKYLIFHCTAVENPGTPCATS